jgi:excisionase family DNA binding protein
VQPDTAADELATITKADLIQAADTFVRVLAARLGASRHSPRASSGDDAAEEAMASRHESEVMDVPAVAAFLQVNRKTVYEYAGRGLIPCRRLGKRILFSRSALVSWLGSCKTASHANGE